MKKKSVFVVLFVLFNQFVFSQEWSYEMNQAGTGLEITRYNGNSTKVNIPSRIEGYPVVSVNGVRNWQVEEIAIPATVTYIGGFEKASSLRRVVIPNSVTTIGSYAFTGSGLFQVEIPDSVTTIGNCAFMRCDVLSSARLSRNTVKIPQNMFSGSALTKIIIPEGVVEIDNFAFYDCRRLEAVTLPSTIKRIGMEAFMLCENLSVINIPDSVKSIEWGGNAFSRIGSISLATMSLLRRLGYKSSF